MVPNKVDVPSSDFDVKQTHKFECCISLSMNLRTNTKHNMCWKEIELRPEILPTILYVLNDRHDWGT